VHKWGEWHDLYFLKDILCIVFCIALRCCLLAYFLRVFSARGGVGSGRKEWVFRDLRVWTGRALWCFLQSEKESKTKR